MKNRTIRKKCVAFDCPASQSEEILMIVNAVQDIQALWVGYTGTNSTVAVPDYYYLFFRVSIYR